MLTTHSGWFKPSDEQGVLFTRYTSLGTLKLRSFQIQSDLDVIYDWVNQDYSRRFWQMNGSKNVLKNVYTDLLKNPATHPFMVLLGDKPVGLIDLYQVMADELFEHIDATPFDCGLHLLMLPPRESVKDLSLQALKCFITFYFTFDQAGMLYAEPDCENQKACLLARKAGFTFSKTIELSYKKANLFYFTRNMR